MPEGSTKPSRVKRRYGTALQTLNPALGALVRQGLELRRRQLDWNALLPLEAQERSWLLSWHGGCLQILVESAAWLSWFRRREKSICRNWNNRFPEEAVQRMEITLRPWQRQERRKTILPVAGISGPAPEALRQLAMQSDGRLRNSLLRLIATLDQAETGTNDSTKEKGTRSGDA